VDLHVGIVVGMRGSRVGLCEGLRVWRVGFVVRCAVVEEAKTVSKAGLKVG